MESCLIESLHLDTSLSLQLNCFSIRWSRVSRFVTFSGNLAIGLFAKLSLIMVTVVKIRTLICKAYIVNVQTELQVPTVAM